MDKKKLTDEEIKQVKELQSKKETAQFEFGNLYLQMKGVQRQEEQLRNVETELMSRFEAILKEEAELLASLEKQYGAGTLNLETGEIATP